MKLLGLFSASDGPHISLKAEPIFSIGDFTVTNAMIYGVIVGVGIVILSIFAARRASIKPTRGITRFYEMALEFTVNLLTDVMGSRQLAYKYAPVFGTFFIFIVISYLAGIIPIVGAGVTKGDSPLFRPFTADLNGTLAMAIIAIILVQYYSIKESGLRGHLKHYFTDKPYNPLNFFIGLLETFGEFTRIISLSLRLFFNTAMGEVLIAIFAYVGAYAATATLLPIIVFEILVAFIQAYVFTVLSATYLGLAIRHHDEAHESIDHSQSELLVEETAIG